MGQSLIVGLDGATFDLIDPLVAAGRLPTFARLLASGVRGRLMSTIPPATVPAWPTFMTGKRPGGHGVFDFYKREPGRERRLVSSRDIEGPTLWRYLSDHDRPCIVLNVPCTYPPEAIRGVLASGMLTPSNGPYVHPPEMAARLDAWTGGYRVNPRAEYVRSPFDRAKLIQELREISDIQKRAFLALLDSEPWDLAMLMFRATDIIQHKLWHRPEDVAAMYEFIDGALDEIMAAAGHAPVWLISDHGFGPLEKSFHINQWLRDQGWLAYRRKEESPASRPQPDAPARQNRPARARSLRGWLGRAGISSDRARAVLPGPVQSLLKRAIPRHVRGWMPRSSYEVDFARTQVFSDSSFTHETQALRINLRTREPGGIVPPDEYEALRDQVIQSLKALRDPETGQTVVLDAYKGDELFAGPYVDGAPDLILRLRDGYKMIGDFASAAAITRLAQVGGCHRRDGIFVAAGPGIAAGPDLGALSIADVMPTLLHAMRLAVPKTCDGQVRLDVFAPGSDPARRPVAYLDVSPGRRSEGQEMAEDEEVLSRLRALGYID